MISVFAQDLIILMLCCFVAGGIVTTYVVGLFFDDDGHKGAGSEVLYQRLAALSDTIGTNGEGSDT